MESLTKPTLYLVPTLIGNQHYEFHIPPRVIKIIHKLRYFYSEKISTARRFLKTINYPENLDQVTFIVINEHNQYQPNKEWLEPFRNGYSAALLSEAGMPCIADPGHTLVWLAHNFNINVVPLTGPGSIPKALMASGLNGQQFTFHGYPPINTKLLRQKLWQIYKDLQKGYTQIFIETPYRTQRTFEIIIQTYPKHLLLCVALNIDSDQQLIKTQSIEKWKQEVFNFGKTPCVFLIGVEKKSTLLNFS